MNPDTQDRTCANCAAFDPTGDVDGGPMCGNLTTFKNEATGKWERAQPDYCCEIHLTAQEDAAQTAYIEANRPAIWASIHANAAIQEAKERASK